MDVALINTNRIKPPIAPIGLDYVAEALHAAGHGVRVLDLCWVEDVPAAIAGFFAHADDGLVGVTLRNTDDCAYTSRESFLSPFAEMAGQVRQHTEAPIVVGGVGFSVMPELVLAHVEQRAQGSVDARAPGSVDAGVWGEGEFAFPRLAACLENGGSTTSSAWRDIPNLIWRQSH